MEFSVASFVVIFGNFDCPCHEDLVNRHFNGPVNGAILLTITFDVKYHFYALLTAGVTFEKLNRRLSQRVYFE